MKNYFKPALMVFILLLSGCNPKKDRAASSSSDPSPVYKQGISTTAINIQQAALEGDFSRVSMALDAGVDPDSTDSEGRTPLMFASYNGHSGIISLLLQKGASVNLKDNYGRTALMMASSGPYPDAVKLLLKHSADPDLTDNQEHFTALMYAAAEGQADIVRILLANKANPKLKDVDGDDALAFARKNGHSEVVKILQPLK